MSEHPPPDALLFITGICPHCPTVLQGLTELLKAGEIGRLEVVNLESHPEQAEAHAVRGVPWLRLGPFELEGLRSREELRRWARRSAEPAGRTDYLRELLDTGALAKATAFVEREDGALESLLPLIADPDTPLQVRLGVGAIMEDLAGDSALARLVPRLAELTGADDPRVRSDACYYLGLSRDPAAAAPVRALLDDPDPQVREVAADSLEALGQDT